VVEFRTAAVITDAVALGDTTVLEFEVGCAALLSVASDVAVLDTALDPSVEVLLLGTATVLEVEVTIEVEFDPDMAELMRVGIVLLLAVAEVNDEVVSVRMALVVRGIVLLLPDTAAFEDEAKDEVVLEAARMELVVEGTVLLLVKTTVLDEETSDDVVLDAAAKALVVEDIVLLTAKSAVFGSDDGVVVALLETLRLEETVEEIVLLLADTTVLEEESIEEVVFETARLEVVAEIAGDEFCGEVETLATIELDPAYEFELAGDAAGLVDDVADETAGELDEETATVTLVLDEETDELETISWYVLCADGLS